MNDLYETRAVKTVFKDKAHQIPISSTKSMTGHLLGGAGGIETVFTALTVHNGILPPTINFENPGEECDLDYVPNVARKKEVTAGHDQLIRFRGDQRVLDFEKIRSIIPVDIEPPGMPTGLTL